MSEYIEIDAELADGGVIHIHTNLQLTAGEAGEQYASAADLEEGSPVANALASIEGIDMLEMNGGEITITAAPDADWHTIIADVSAALKDFFL